MSGQAFVNGPGCSCPPGLGHPHTWRHHVEGDTLSTELDMKVWRAICDESYGTKKDRRAELAKRARRARWPEAPPPPTQLGMFG